MSRPLASVALVALLLVAGCAAGGPTSSTPTAASTPTPTSTPATNTTLKVGWQTTPSMARVNFSTSTPTEPVPFEAEEEATRKTREIWRDAASRYNGTGQCEPVVHYLNRSAANKTRHDEYLMCLVATNPPSEIERRIQSLWNGSAADWNLTETDAVLLYATVYGLAADASMVSYDNTTAWAVTAASLEAKALRPRLLDERTEDGGRA